MIKVGKNILKEVYKQRSPDVHKYDFGLLLVIGGGEFYTGSPTLAALAAFKTGVDMVRILAPKRAADIIATFSPNLIGKVETLKSTSFSPILAVNLPS